jgi:hypothetical protein
MKYLLLFEDNTFKGADEWDAGFGWEEGYSAGVLDIIDLRANKTYVGDGEWEPIEKLHS